MTTGRVATRGQNHETLMAGRLPVGTKLGYASGQFANAIVGGGLVWYLLVFYTDIAGLAAPLAGVALAVGRFWDAITDPTMGHISDRTRSRFGRRRPYILAGAPFLAAAFVMLWWAPVGQAQSVLFMFLLAGNLFLTTAQTVVGIPYGSLGAELTMDYHERTSVMAYQQGAFLAGSIIGTGLLCLASSIGAVMDPEIPVEGISGVVSAFGSAAHYAALNGVGFRIAALGLAPLVIGALGVTVFATRENPRFQRTTTVPAWQSLLSTLKNRPFRLFMLAFLIATTVSQIGGFMLPYIIIHYLAKPAFLMPAFLVYTGSTFLGIPLWRFLGQRFEKKHCYMMSLASSFVVAPLFMVMVKPDWPVGFFAWGAMAGVSAGGGLVYAPSIMADIIDTDELASGLRREGSFLGIHSLLMKCAGSLGALWVGPGLWLVGYDGQAEAQSEQTLFLMRVLFVFPGVFANIFVIYVVSRFPLTAKVMDEVHRKIAGLRAQHQAEGETHAV